MHLNLGIFLMVMNPKNNPDNRLGPVAISNTHPFAFHIQ